MAIQPVHEGTVVMPDVALSYEPPSYTEPRKKKEKEKMGEGGKLLLLGGKSEIKTGRQTHL
jgi:hypothetical protein